MLQGGPSLGLHSDKPRDRSVLEVVRHGPSALADELCQLRNAHVVALTDGRHHTSTPLPHTSLGEGLHIVVSAVRRSSAFSWYTSFHQLDLLFILKWLNLSLMFPMVPTSPKAVS